MADDDVVAGSGAHGAGSRHGERAAKYRLDYRRTAWVDMTQAGVWYGGPWLIVRGQLSSKYGGDGPVPVDRMGRYIEAVERAVKRGRITPVTFGKPFRRQEIRNSLDTGAWIMPTSEGSYIDADLAALADLAVDGEWAYVRLRVSRLEPTFVKVAGRTVNAMVAPIRARAVAGNHEVPRVA